MGLATAPAGAHDDRLKRNAIGLQSAMAMSLAFISPTIGVIFISALIANQAGASAPFAFIIGTIGVMLMANTLASSPSGCRPQEPSTRSLRGPVGATWASSSGGCCS